MSLSNLSNIVRSNFKQLTESQIVGRIMLVSGRNLERSVNGYKILREEKLLEGFVEPKTEGKFLALLDRYPNLKEAIDQLDLIPEKSGIINPNRKDPPKVNIVLLVRDALNLTDF